MTRLQELYKNTVANKLKEQFGYKNVNQIPKVTKVVVNAGVGRAAANSKFLEDAVETIGKITGQKPVITKAKKSIAGFKIRTGMNLGVMVTLRDQRMYEFIDRLVNVSLPRVRDFRGLNAKMDGHGNYSLGLKEHGVFPEISFEEASTPIALEVTVVTTAKSDEEAKALLNYLGFPFKD
jgi:large subunit ribosomal protein L5